jgi:hypothetical protein
MLNRCLHFSTILSLGRRSIDHRNCLPQSNSQSLYELTKHSTNLPS